MKSIIRSNIITNEKIIHDSKIEAKRLYEIAKEAEISIQKLGEMFGLKEIGKSKVRNRTGKVELKIYTIYELQEIKKKIKQEYKDVLEINQEMLRDIENKYKIGDKHNLTLEEFIQYSDKREEIRNMYQESIRNNQKIQMNSKTRMTNQFFEENFEEIQRRMAYCITNFCISHRCLQEKEDYIQDGYEFLMAEGGYIAENMKHDKEKCIKILCHRVVAQITKKHYQEMVTKRLNIEYQNIEIPDDCNRNYIDTRFSPEKILEEKEEIEQIHRVIVQNMKNNLNFASNMPKEFLKVLSYELGTEEEETEKLIEEIQLIILQNQLAKQDSKGRIIPINK